MDASDLLGDMFKTLAILEIYSAAYIDADCFFSRTAPNGGGVVSAPRDRLLSYL